MAFKLRSGNNIIGRNGKGVMFKKMGSSPLEHTKEMYEGREVNASHPGDDGHMPWDRPEEHGVDEGGDPITTETKTTGTTEKPVVEKTKETTYISSDSPKYISKGFANYIIRKGGTVEQVNALAKRNNQRPVYNEDGTFIEYDD